MLYIFALCHGILFPHALMMLSCMYLSQRRLKKGAKILRMLVPSQDTGFVELAYTYQLFRKHTSLQKEILLLWNLFILLLR